MNKMYYYDFGTFLKRQFPFKVQKISINAGFTCPNRTGEKGWGGCTYCNNQTFSPEYCHTEKSVTEQVKEGISFFGKKYPEMKYLAYFQAYTNTYDSIDILIEKYEEALHICGVVGIIIGTRPDCVSNELLSYLSDLAKETFVLIEYGVESTNDSTLKFINRGHTYEDSEKAIIQTAKAGIMTGAHMILGLPHESRDMIISHAVQLSRLPLTTLKLHQLQLIRHTRMAHQYEENPEWFHLYNVDEYVDVVIDFMEYLRSDIVIERFVSQSPKDLLIAPQWGLKNYEFTARLLKRMKERGTWQGRYAKGIL